MTKKELEDTADRTVNGREGMLSHLVIVLFCIGIKVVNDKFRMLVRPMIRQKKIVHSQPMPISSEEQPSWTRSDTYEYVASSSYAVECPMPLNDPAVASERCVSKPPSERPTFITRRSSTRRFDKKSDEL